MAFEHWKNIVALFLAHLMLQKSLELVKNMSKIWLMEMKGVKM
jgi:hypothetical protein